MIRRLFIYGVLVGFALLVWTQAVEAQGCYPGNQPTLAVTTVQALQPIDAAAQGAVAITTYLYSSNASGSVHSHNALYTVGTWIGLDVITRNAQSRSWYYTINGGSTHYGAGSASGFSGTQTWTGPNAWLANAYDVGNTMTFVNTAYTGLNQTGTGTQTKVSFTVVDGTKLSPPVTGPAVVMQDKIETNLIYSVTTTYSGIPQISFADCPQMRYAHHTPHATIQLQSTSGEIHPEISSDGQTVGAGSTVFATVSDFFSADPGDSITGNFGGWTFCDLHGGSIWDALISFRVEYARVVVKDLGHAPRPGSEKPIPSVIYDVATICDNNSDPCDWQPTVVHSWSSRHPYWWGVTSLFRAPDLSGVPWIPVASYLSDIDGFVSPSGGPWALAELIAIGGAVPYPANIGPDFPVPGACTQYPKNVLMTLGSADIPWWPWSN